MTSRPGVAGLVATLALCLGLTAPAAATFDLGIHDERFLRAGSAVDRALLDRVGATTLRAEASWAGLSPTDPSVGGAPADDPANPAYRWSGLDDVARRSAAAGRRLLLTVNAAPAWAEGPNRPSPTGSPNDRDVRPGAWDPNPDALGAFARAIARRYDGTYPDPSRPGAPLPRVRAWQFWNEPNLPYYFAAPNATEAYRTLLNRFYDGVKAAHPDNVVVFGGMAPVSFLGKSIRPLRFAADVMCLRRTGTRFVRRASCAEAARFDVMATHPYSLAATPTKHAYRYDDLLVADTSKLTAAVRAAERLRTIAPAGVRRPLWVTEWAWFTNPPNTRLGDSPAAAARYVATALHLMWQADVQLVTWFTLEERSDILPAGGGLLTAAGRSKATARAFAFPFVARVRGTSGSAWGKAPGAGRSVVVERRVARRWRAVARTRSRADGVFTARFRARGNASYRARAGGRTSLAYFSAPVPARRIHAEG